MSTTEISTIIKKSDDLKTIDLLNEFNTSINSLSNSLKAISTDPDVKFGDKVDTLMLSMISLVPVLLNELSPDKHEVDEAKSNQVMRVTTLLNSIQNSMYRKREVEVKEEIDVTHPKFQKVIEFLMDSVLDTMGEIGIDTGMQSTFIHKFATKMIGFEETMNKKLKGISFQDLDSVSNPLIREFNENRKGS